MSKPEFLHEEETPKRSYKKLRNQLLVIICFILATIAYVELTRVEPETRKVHSMYEFRGHFVDGKPVLIDEYCTK